MGDVRVVPNQARQIFYVVKVKTRHPADDAEKDAFSRPLPERESFRRRNVHGRPHDLRIPEHAAAAASGERLGGPAVREVRRSHQFRAGTRPAACAVGRINGLSFALWQCPPDGRAGERLPPAQLRFGGITNAIIAKAVSDYRRLEIRALFVVVAGRGALAGRIRSSRIARFLRGSRFERCNTARSRAASVPQCGLNQLASPESFAKRACFSRSRRRSSRR